MLHHRNLCVQLFNLLLIVKFCNSDKILSTKQVHQQGLNNKDANIQIVHEAVRSACQIKDRVVHCAPPFTNLAEIAKIESTSTCGEVNQSETVCHDWYDSLGRQQSKCDLCDSPTKFGAHLLTDRHQMNNETCWISGKIKPGKQVNVTLSLGKRFEVYYISLTPCGQLPDSIALYKSSDFGVTWRPWQYFSTDCYKAFRLPTSNEHNTQISLANIQEVLCVSLHHANAKDNSQHTSNVIAFSTTIGRPSALPWSSALIDWMTMTDLKISLMKFPEPKSYMQHDSSRLYIDSHLSPPANIFRLGDMDKFISETGTLGMSRHLYQSDMTPVDSTTNQSPGYFSLSDISIGGRCKCNGHANRCVRDKIIDPSFNKVNENTPIKWGPIRCDCQHNTEGTDCERCASGYLDRPWARATSQSANECKRCDCNLHSNSCIFSNQIYLMTAKSSGGVCQHCEHNTIGRRCHHCSPGYYRDWTKPISHEQVCLECRCHPIGSIPNQYCDRKTGQCACKTGVTGQACNRCQDGYKQTRLPNAPCIKATEHYAYRPKEHHTAYQSKPPSTDLKSKTTCAPCERNGKRMNFKKFCRHDAVFQGTVKSRSIHGELMSVDLNVKHIWRSTAAVEYLLPKSVSTDLTPYRVWVKLRSTVPNKNEVTCPCPDLKVGSTYLFITRSHQVPYGERMELLLDSNSVILPWRKLWDRRLQNFVRRESNETCNVHTLIRNRKQAGRRQPSKIHYTIAKRNQEQWAMQ